MIKIVADREIPFLKGVLEPYAEVRYLDPADITHNAILDADCLIIRSRTKCSAALLDGTSVKMVATATISSEHVDTWWCREHGIFVQTASGCSVGAVMNYVFSAMYGCAARRSIDLTGATLGIIGAGATGSKIESVARLLGFKVLLFDPPRAEAEGGSQFCDLETLLDSSDIVSMHVPITDSTRGMCSAAFFDRMKLGAFFINTSRGELVDEDALLEAVPKLGPVIIDTWKNEPRINTALMEKVDVATPHIAAYSYQGKLNAAMLVVRAVARFYGIKELYGFFPVPDIPDLQATKIELLGLSQGQRTSVLQYNYPIFTDDFIFRCNPENFEQLRDNYHLRREFFID